MTIQSAPVGVLFVCMGNICRSPTARGVFTKLVREAGLDHVIRVDSAGTIDYHAGEAPDTRAQAAAMRHGIDLSGYRARQVRSSDFTAFDYILAMDQENLTYLHMKCPEENRHRIQLFLNFAPHAKLREVPDPYYGGEHGFDHVISLVQEASQGLLDHIQKHRLQ